MITLRSSLCFLIISLLTACVETNLNTANTPTIEVAYTNTYRVSLLAASNGASASQFEWDFGDGHKGQGQRIEHNYLAAGQYTLSLFYVLENQQYEIQTTLQIGSNPKSLEIYNDIAFVSDSDTNDPSQPFESNNTKPQLIPTFSTVSGVLMRANACQAGALCKKGDLIDRYNWTWQPNQSIKLSCISGSLNVRLISSGGTSWSIHLEEGNEKIISANTIPSDFLSLDLELTNDSQKSFYQFRIVEDDTQNRAYQPGKLIVKWKGQASPELVDLTDPRLTINESDPYRAARLLSEHSQIAYAAPNYYRQPSTDETIWQWPLLYLDMPALWQWSRVYDRKPAEGSVIAVLDSGVYFDHPNLKMVDWVSPKDFVSDPINSGDGDGWDDDPSDPGYTGSIYHGTHVTGIIAAQATDNDHFWGASYGAQIMPLRVLGLGGGTSYDLIQALRFAAGLSNETKSAPVRRADVINLSLGGNEYSPIERLTLDEIANSGVIVVAASGNQGKSLANYPARYSSVVSVGALDRYGSIAPYTNAPNETELLAPGGWCESSQCLNGINSTSALGIGDSQNPYWRSLSGTSMASAFVSAQIAWLKSAHPGLDNKALRQALSSQILSYTESTREISSFLAMEYANHLEQPTEGLWSTTSTVHMAANSQIALPLFQSSRDLSELDIETNKALLNVEVHNQTLFIETSEEFSTVEHITLRHQSGAHLTIAVEPIQPMSSNPWIHHLYVQFENSYHSANQLRASLSKGYWQAYLPNVELNSWIQVSTDLDYDGVLCEFGEFCAILDSTTELQSELKISGNVLN